MASSLASLQSPRLDRRARQRHHHSRGRMSYHDQDLRKPILPGTAATDYERYLRTDDLFTLQKPPEKMSHPDELTFQVVHQSSELLMKAVIFDLERVRVWISEGKLGQAARLMRRAN